MPAAYLVHHASLYRGHGLLRVEILSAGGKGVLHVEGNPERTITITGGRHCWGENNELLEAMIFVIDPPSFPISELIGKKLVRVESPSS